MERLRRGQKVQNYETKRKDGTLIDVSVTVSLVMTRGGEITGASAVARDITERKQASVCRAACGISDHPKGSYECRKAFGSTAISIRLARSSAGLETTIEDNGSGFE